jgi:hypothetical protein
VLPALLIVTTIVSVAFAPEARLAIVPCTLCPLLLALIPLPLTLCTLRPVGTTSVTLTLLAALGPRLLTTSAKLIVAPAPVPLGVLAVLTMRRSALALTAAVAVAVLLAVFGSAVVVVIVLVPLTCVAGTVKVTVCETEAPTASVGVLKLAVVITPPAVPMTTLPVTLAAVLVPLLLQVIVAVTTVPAVAPAGSWIVVATSALGSTETVTVLVLLLGTGSGVVLVTLALLV